MNVSVKEIIKVKVMGKMLLFLDSPLKAKILEAIPSIQGLKLVNNPTEKLTINAIEKCIFANWSIICVAHSIFITPCTSLFKDDKY